MISQRYGHISSHSLSSKYSPPPFNVRLGVVVRELHRLQEGTPLKFHGNTHSILPLIKGKPLPFSFKL